jgi:endonuclease III
VGTHDEMQYATWLYLQTNPRMTDILVCFVDTILDQRTTDERMALGVRELATYPEHIIPSCFVLD